jgi:hypothetical protein
MTCSPRPFSCVPTSCGASGRTEVSMNFLICDLPYVQLIGAGGVRNTAGGDYLIVRRCECKSCSVHHEQVLYSLRLVRLAFWAKARQPIVHERGAGMQWSLERYGSGVGKLPEAPLNARRFQVTRRPSPGRLRGFPLRSFLRSCPPATCVRVYGHARSGDVLS